MYKKIKDFLKDDKILSVMIFGLLISLPILDILSYFAVLYEMTSITTLIRMFIFLAIVGWAFIISDNKKIYLSFVFVLGCFWMIHILVNLKEGYISIVQDTAMYIRTVQGPMLAIAFITMLSRIRNASQLIGNAFWINYMTISFSILLSYIVEMPVYTYGYSEIGIKGWFYTGNSQSCILAIMALLALCYAYKKKNVIFFIMTITMVFGNLYFFGTKVTYLSIFIVSISFLVLLLWNKEKNVLNYIVILCGAILCFMTYEKSPCYMNQYKEANSFVNNNAVIQEIVETSSNGEVNEEQDKAENNSSNQHTIKSQNVDTGDRQETNYEDIYGETCPALVERFGLERVVEKFDYSVDAYDIMNNRKLKINYCSLVMDEKGVLTHLFGYEYMDMLDNNGEIYDPENDFPALYFLYGYIGVGLYIGFIIFFVFVALKNILSNIKVLEMEKGSLCISLALLVGCAQMSGNVFRRPNVSIYFAIMLACLFVFCRGKMKKLI